MIGDSFRYILNGSPKSTYRMIKKSAKHQFMFVILVVANTLSYIFTTYNAQQ
jgi:hypothetical protein